MPLKFRFRSNFSIFVVQYVYSVSGSGIFDFRRFCRSLRTGITLRGWSKGVFGGQFLKMDTVPVWGFWISAVPYLECLLLYTELVFVSFVRTIEKYLVFGPSTGTKSQSTHRVNDIRRDTKIKLNSVRKLNLKGQCHEIFDPRFFRQSITPRPLINTLQYFRILFWIRRAIRSQTFV
jgi:hypothetical protein